MTMRELCIAIVACMMLLSLLAPTAHRDRLTWGGAAPNAPTIRRIRLTNKGTAVVVFSKVGLYAKLDDATGNLRDWIEDKQASVRFYTNGLASIKGDALNMTSTTPQSYDTVSGDHYVALPVGTSLVVDLNADVPLAAIRMGQINSTATQRRLLVETGGTNIAGIVDADFVAGFVRLSGAVAAPPPDSYIGASGIYEYAAQPSGFAPTSPTAFYSYPPTAGVITRFQSSSDAVNAGNLGVMGENYTIECLFKSTSVTSYRNLCDMNYNATNVGPRFEQTSDKSAYWVWSARGSFTTSPPFALSEGAWYYTAFVMSNGLVSTYLNDVQTASNVPTRGDGFPTTFGSVQIGMGYSADRHFIGEIAMFRIYKTALTAAEVRQNAARAMSLSSSTTAPSPVAPAMVKSAVTSGLVIKIDVASSYPGVGSEMANLAGTGTATLYGKYELVSIAGKMAIHIINTSNSNNSNVSGLLLPRADVRTISLWIYVSFTTVPTAYTYYVCDGRQTTSETYLVQGQGFTQIGAVWNGVSVYLNGGSAQNISQVFVPFNSVSNSWQHVTLISTSLLSASVFNLFSNSWRTEGMDVNIGSVSVYNRVLSQEENNANFLAGFGRPSTATTSAPSPVVAPASTTSSRLAVDATLLNVGACIISLSGVSRLFSYRKAVGLTIPSGATRTTQAASLLTWTFPTSLFRGSSCFCIRMVLDTTLLAYPTNATIFEGCYPGTAGDPGIYFGNGGIYATEQHRNQVTQVVSISPSQWSGKLDVIYLNDQTARNGLISVTGDSFTSIVPGRTNCWASCGVQADGTGIGVVFNQIVVQADFWWRDHGQTPPISSPQSAEPYLPDNWRA
jgi:hypothetical protein